MYFFRYITILTSKWKKKRKGRNPAKRRRLDLKIHIKKFVKGQASELWITGRTKNFILQWVVLFYKKKKLRIYIAKYILFKK